MHAEHRTSLHENLMFSRKLFSIVKIKSQLRLNEIKSLSAVLLFKSFLGNQFLKFEVLAKFWLRLTVKYPIGA